MSSSGARREAGRGAADAWWGFVIGAGIGEAAHFADLAATSAGATDEATLRITAELARLGHETSAFMAAIGLAVALASGAIGVVCALGLRWGWPHLERWRRLPWVAAATGVTLLSMVLRAFVRQPALLEPSLGGAEGTLARPLAWAASWMAPWMIDGALAAALVAVLALGARRRAVTRRALVRTACALAACSLLSLLPRLWAPRPGATLLILAADSLRPDRMSEETAPHLLALARNGVSFDVALSPMASTTPAWVSILTGRYPHAHGIRTMFPRRELRLDWLDTLPRRLDGAGFRTSVVSDYAGDFFPLFDFGFQRARTSPPLTLGLVYQRELVTHSAPALALLNHRLGRALFPVFRFLMTNADPERLADEVLDELRDSSGKKSLVVAFFSTTHVPFAAPYPWYRRLASPSYGGPHRYLYDVQKLADVTSSDVRLPERDVAQVRRLYDGALEAVDAAIGRILAQLDDDTTVVLLADHGENLFEPGNTTFHGKWFRGGDEANRVPLIIAGPSAVRGLHVPEPVSLVDLMPTLLEISGLPAGGLDGVSLAGAVGGGHAPEHDVFAETAVWLNGPPERDGVRYPPLPRLLEADPDDHFALVLKTRFEDVEVEAKHRMLRRNQMKLLYIPTVDGARWQLYDMRADPRQEHALAAPPDMQRALLRFLARDPERELDARQHLVRRSED
jgi:arylsulfatase A-like enzyme